MDDAYGYPSDPFRMTNDSSQRSKGGWLLDQVDGVHQIVGDIYCKCTRLFLF
jgi:hypothetical protein